MVGGRGSTSPVPPHLQPLLLSEDQLRSRLLRGGPRDDHDEAEPREAAAAGEAATEPEEEMDKSPRFNWRVFLFLRQRQLMLLGGAFLVLVLSSSLVYSVLEAGEGLMHQHLTGGLGEEEDALLDHGFAAQAGMLEEQEVQLSTGLAENHEDDGQQDAIEWLQKKRLEHQANNEQQPQQSVEGGSAKERVRHKGSYTSDSLLAAWEALEKDPAKAREINRDRLEAVHAAVLHSWEGYKQFAWGDDELLPETREGKTWFGLGLTLVDSLDLLWLIDEKAEFQDAAQWVADQLDPSVAADVNVFEVTIRVMGGLLSAYHYSQDDVFLKKARELGENLKGAFHTRSGVPYSDVNLATKQAYAPAGAPDSSTSEATSIQMEFKYLAYLTDDPDLYHMADKSMHAIEHAAKTQLPADMRALLPMYINTQSGQFRQGSTITLGARGDSYYEYLLKQWLLTGKKQTRYLDKYLEAVDAIKDKLLGYSYPHGLGFIGELAHGQRFSPKMDHLVCFLPGTLALGYMHGLDRWHLDLAKELMLTCYELYNSTVTGLSPEIAYFNMGEEGGAYDILIQPRDAHNILRPETVESLFYLHKATLHEQEEQQQQGGGEEEAGGASVYQEWGWKIFTAFEEHSRVPTGGYSGLHNVQDVSTGRINKMESFWLGETLKYFYLLFSERDLVPLDRYVFNTEAHPIPIFLPPWLGDDEQQRLDDEVDWPEEEEQPPAAQAQQQQEEGGEEGREAAAAAGQAGEA